MLAFLLPFAIVQAATPVTPVTPASVVAAAKPGEWTTIAPADLLVMDLAPDGAGRSRRVVIQLMPRYSHGWVSNVRIIAHAHWWDGTSVNRVQDNYVVQWGDATEKKPLPAGLTKVPEAAYEVYLPPDNLPEIPTFNAAGELVGTVRPKRAGIGFGNVQTPYVNVSERIIDGWPEAMNGDRSWPVHCYGMVGVGRNNSPDTGTGAELYTVIGHAPRQLDRNIALVGRVVEGIEHLSSLPRGTAELGFYKTAAERVAIRSVRLASDLPEGERPRLQYLSTESASFAAYANARANRRDAFYIRPAGGADVCNVPVPIRRAP